MAAPALAPILKKVAVYVVSDKKLLKTVLGIALGVIFIILMPLIALFSIISGGIQLDNDYIQNNIISRFTTEETVKFEKIELDMNLIQTKMTEAGYDDTKVKRAQVLYTLALYDYSDQEGFIDDLIGCFDGATDDEQLINAVNLKFGTNISHKDFMEVIQSIETDNASSENSG